MEDAKAGLKIYDIGKYLKQKIHWGILIEIGYCRIKRHEFEDTAIETMQNKAQLEMKD